MTVSKRILAAFLVSMAFAAPSVAQEVSLEMHWVGLFGPYSAKPLPNDPLPNVTLFPFGEIPRPLVRTDKIPGKLGTRFGLLFTLHGARARVVQVIHYPPPGLPVGPGAINRRDVEVPMYCMADLPCYVGYRFERKEEILPGEWRMELLVNGATAYEAKFVVEVEAEQVRNDALDSAHRAGGLHAQTR